MRPERPNIILLTVDCLRADHLGCFGYDRETSPTVDLLAKNGVLFTQAASVSSTTHLSFPAMLGSIYPLMCRNRNEVFSGAISIANVLRETGYSTAAFHSNVRLSRRFGYHRGFDHFEDLAVYPHTDLVSRGLSKLMSKAKILLRGGENPKASGEEINEAVMEWVKKQNGDFFAWCHYMDAHVPYMPPAPYLSFFSDEKLSERRLFRIYHNMLRTMNEPETEEMGLIVDLYDACVRYIDDCVKRLVEGLKDLDRLDNTVILITADHGEEFGEHGNLTHHRKLYDELIHVPLIIYNLKGCRSRVVETPVSLIDLAPTLADLAGAERVQRFKGISMLPYIREGKRSRVGTISEADGLLKGKMLLENTRVIAYRTQRWKLIQIEKPYSFEMYDLKNDPSETRNVYEKNRNVARDLQERIEQHLEMIRTELRSSEKERISKALVKTRF